MVVTEKEDENKHIHAAFWLRKAERPNDFKRRIVRQYQQLEKEGVYKGIIKYMVVSKVMYNDDWYTKYCQKGDNTEIILHKVNPVVEERSKYYKDVPQKKDKVADYQMDKLETLWNGEEGKTFGWNDTSQNPLHVKIRRITLDEAERFICHLMFNKRVIRVIQNASKMRRLCKCFVAYVNKTTSYPWEMRNNVVGSVYQPPKNPDIHTGL